MSTLTTLSDTPRSTSSQESADGLMLLEELVGAMTSPCGQLVALASPSATPAPVAALTTSATSGPICVGSLKSADLQSSLASRLQARLQNRGSTLYNMKWSSWTMPSGLLRSRLRASVPRTSVTGCIGWVTPTTRDHKDTPGMTALRDGKERIDQLPRQAYQAGWGTPTSTDALRHPSLNFTTKNLTLNHGSLLAAWPTPTANSTTGAGSTGRAGGLNIQTAAQLAGYPTPTANVKNQPETKRGLENLSGLIKLAAWPTPTCQSPNSLRGKGQDPMKRKEQGHAVNLTDAVNFVELSQPVRLTASGQILIGSFAAMESGGQLSPAHSRWLMGLPPEWCACAPTAIASTSSKPKSSSKRSRTPKRHPLV